MENPVSDAPLNQVGLTPAAKIELTLLPNIRMPPVDGMSAGDFICIFEFRFGRRMEKAREFDPFGHAGFDPTGIIRLTP